MVVLVLVGGDGVCFACRRLAGRLLLVMVTGVGWLCVGDCLGGGMLSVGVVGYVVVI